MTVTDGALAFACCCLLLVFVCLLLFVLEFVLLFVLEFVRLRLLPRGDELAGGGAMFWREGEHHLTRL